MSDRLAEIKARQQQGTIGEAHEMLVQDMKDINWLISQLEHLRSELQKPRRDRAFGAGLERAAVIAVETHHHWPVGCGCGGGIAEAIREEALANGYI